MKACFHWMLGTAISLLPQMAWGESLVGMQFQASMSSEEVTAGEYLAKFPAMDPVAELSDVHAALPGSPPGTIGPIRLAGYVAEHRRASNYWQFGKLHTSRRGRASSGAKATLALGLVARGLYLNDQRIQWSGVETTIAGEGALYTEYRVHSGNWITSVESELFLNQPTDKNILLDTQERRSYAANYDIDPLELSRLNVAIRSGDWELRAGKMWTPFGRYYSQLWNNQLIDAPFIRTESIRWRETGLLVRWDPGAWVVETGVFNGYLNRDANSAKALVARVGTAHEHWACGASIKWQDGPGSEH